MASVRVLFSLNFSQEQDFLFFADVLGKELHAA
jgi:hypothetical protein